MKSGWSAPFAPWVVKSWENHLRSIGYTKEIHDEKLRLIKENIRIANDPTLTYKEKVSKITKR